MNVCQFNLLFIKASRHLLAVFLSTWLLQVSTTQNSTLLMSGYISEECLVVLLDPLTFLLKAELLHLHLIVFFV
jgi:hypothetical protein